MSTDRVIVALFFLLTPGFVLQWCGGERGKPGVFFTEILVRLRHECDPANPESDYSRSQGSLPTERKREAIIEACRREGLALLPQVRRQIAEEKDEEVRGMLQIIAAALGDGAAVKKAGQEMAWSDSPAVRISAAKTLQRLQDRRSIEWFLVAVDDDHFVVNGACGIQRERFYPVRDVAQAALHELFNRYPDDRLVQQWRGHLSGMQPFETLAERGRRLREVQLRQLESKAAEILRKMEGG